MTEHKLTDPIDLLAIAGEIKLVAPDDAKAGEVTGYGAVFGNVDLGGDVIEPGAFAASIKARGTRPLPMLFAHDHGRPIGSWTRLAEDGRGLVVKGRLNLDTVAGREARALLLAGDVGGLSIGYQVPPGGAVYDASGKRKLKRVDLHEVSLVAVPMNPSATVTAAKSIEPSEIKTIGDLRELLVSAGLSRRTAEKVAAGGFPALDPDQAAADLSARKSAADLVAALHAAAAAFERK